ncbi:hypothetical protein EON63_17130 [archaeon]|nr:MAG: hypothetical protein EON63_17130 [archaeon]
MCAEYKYLTHPYTYLHHHTPYTHQAYNSLADFYVRNKDHKTGYFFHEKCLEVAQLTNDIRAEMGANHSLGMLYIWCMVCSVWCTLQI